MTRPLVSVCLPNLNTRPYLEERVDTIFSQTYANWELVVSDNFSEDGAWEFFEALASKDRRVLIAQAPREGLYANWNNCIRRARGDYVYIATSDDTMASDCLEKMVAALESRFDCDLAHCKLKLIDETGSPTHDPIWRWPACTLFAQGEQGLEDIWHIRRAPHDGILHLARRMVYHSITELLIRRSLFSKIGPFESRWASVGDFNWNMKAGLVASTVHVPDTWASFRYHPLQATASVNTWTADFARKYDEMILDAVRKCEPFLTPEVVGGLRGHWLSWSRDIHEYYRGLKDLPNPLHRRLFQASQLIAGTEAARAEVFGRLRGKAKWPDRAADELRCWMASLGLDLIIRTSSQPA